MIDNNGTVRFSPVAGFYGTATLTYAITDSLGNTANATMSVAIDPSGVLYDSTTRLPLAGATVTLQYNGGNADALVVGGNATQVSNGAGQYAFFIVGGAPAGTYSLVVSKAGYTSPSATIPPTAGGWPAGGGPVTAIVGPPTGVQPTTYYLSGPLPTLDVTNNNIPIDAIAAPPPPPPPPGGVTGVPTLSEWGAMILSTLVAMFGLWQVRRREVNGAL